MPHYNVVIETRETEFGYRASVAEGPHWTKEVGTAFGYQEARDAYLTAKSRIKGQAPRGYTFDFLHVEQ